MGSLRELVYMNALAGAGLNHGRIENAISSDVMARVTEAVFMPQNGGAADSLSWEIMQEI